MISPHVLERTLWGVAALGIVATVVGVRGAVPTPLSAAPVVWSAPAVPAPVVPESLASFADDVVETDPFRLDRAPAAVPYSDGGENAVAPPPPAAPAKPPLALSGIVGGPPWSAILDGVPGQTGSVLVHAGDVVGARGTPSALHVQRVDRRGTVITGMDTTWNLPLKQPWR